MNRKPATVPPAAVASAAAGVLVLCAGCASPLNSDPDRELRHTIITSTQREIRQAQESYQILTTTREPRSGTLGFRPETLAEVEKISGPASYENFETRMSPSLLGKKQELVRVNLQRVLLSAVENNLSVQFARLAPAIEETRMVSAEAAFDWTFFSTLQWSALDNQTPGAFGVTSVEAQSLQTTFGLRRKMTSGGSFTVQPGGTYTDNSINRSAFQPQPATAAEFTLQYDQPLLRNFGSDVALAEVRLATNAQRDQVQVLKANLIKTVGDTEEAYWNLVSAYGQLQIVERLLDRGIKVRDVLKVRQASAGDVRPSQFSDAVAQVTAREAEVSRAENTLRQASDRLKVLINDRDLVVGSDVLLLPADKPVDQAIVYSLADSLFAALQNRPEVQRAILGIDDSSIRQTVADNQRLPLLDLRAQSRFNNLAGGLDRAVNGVINGGFIDFLVGLAFEQPIGNRAAEAGFRKARLERSQAVLAYRDVVQRITLDVVTALRNTETNYRLIEQTRAARMAAAENVRALDVEERTIQGLTAEFLDLKLRRQRDLASAEAQELASLTDYNTAIARLHAATGTALERNRIKFNVPMTRDVDTALPTPTEPPSEGAARKFGDPLPFPPPTLPPDANKKTGAGN